MKKYFSRILWTTLLAVFIGSACAGKQTNTPTIKTDDITLQLQWVTQAQFAGYYVALEKGWYKEENINLTIRPGGPDISPINSVRSGAAQFGTSLLADVLVAAQSTNDLVSIAQIQQTNGLLLIAKKESGIRAPKDFEGKKVGIWLGNWEAQFDALIAKEGIDPGKFTLVAQGFSMDAFLNGELDVASAMIYNEYNTVIENGYKPGDINIINYADYGLDFPGDVLFTSKKLAEENPDLMIRMLRASLRGWEYAVQNHEEAADIVLKYDNTGIQNREHQIAMIREIAKLVQAGIHPIGYTDRADIARVINELFTYNILKTQMEPDTVFTNEFWEKAQPSQ